MRVITVINLTRASVPRPSITCSSVPCSSVPGASILGTKIIGTGIIGTGIIGTGIIVARIVVAETCISRAIGLLGKAGIDAGSGLLIRPSSGVHTIGMRFPIDVVGLDAGLRVVRLWPDLQPFRVTAVSFRVRSVLELAAGRIAATGLCLGDQLQLEPAHLSPDSRLSRRVAQTGGCAEPPVADNRSVSMSSAEPDAPPNAPLKASKRPHTAAILLLALLTRLAMMVYVLRHFPRGWLFTKGMELGILGRLLALGQGFNSPFGGDTGPTAFLAPGYPFVVSIVFRIFGVYTRQSVYAILFLHIACGVATVWLVMHIARRTMGASTANVAGLIWALSVPLVWMPVIFWDTSASALLLAGMAAIALRLSRRPALLLWIVAGLYCGLTSLINPSLSLALLALLGWAAWQTGHARRRSSLRAGTRPAPAHGLYTPPIALLVMFAVFLPWPIRNARVFHAFIPFRSNLGYELWNGNQPGGSGRFIEALHPMLSEAEYDEYAALGEVAYMREKSDLGKASIRAHKVEFMRTSAWRVMAFWMGLAQGSVENSGIVTFHAVVTSCLGFAGLLVLFRRKRRLAWLFLLPLLVFPLPYYVTHPDFRFRLLLDPLVTILAAYALTSAWAFWRRHHPEWSHARHAWS